MSDGQTGRRVPRRKMLAIGLNAATLTAAVVFGLAPFDPGYDAEIEKAAVSRVIEDNIGWFKTKDFNLLFTTCSNGPDLFMYQLDSATTIRGFAELEKYSVGWKNPDVRYAGHKIHDLTVRISRSGDAAWFSARLEDCARVKDRAPRCFTSRYTGVLEKREGRWILVQQHFSLPAELIDANWASKTAHPPTKDIVIQ